MQNNIKMTAINGLLKKEMTFLQRQEVISLMDYLINRLSIEFLRQDKSGIYGLTQRLLTYNSNKIEGSTLTEKQTAALFETGTILASEDVYRAKDVEETRGHFLMFNEILKTHHQPLTEELIKKYHFRLKSGVFEDIANGYPIGEYKNRKNMVSDIVTASPDEVTEKMQNLITEYETGALIDIIGLAKFHADYEQIHPFQDGNGRTGRVILYKECLRHKIIPFIVTDKNKGTYYAGLNKAQTENQYDALVKLFVEEQESYYSFLQNFLYEYD